MTAPAVLSDPNSNLAKWHEVALLASRLPTNDPRRVPALSAARRAIYGWATARQGVDDQTARMERVPGGQGPLGTAASFAAGFGQGASFGFADELSGAVNYLGAQLNPVTAFYAPQAYREGRDQHRAFVEEAKTAHGTAEFAGDLTGTVLSSLIGAKGATAAFPALGRAVAGGAVAGATRGARLVSGAAGALLGGAEGAVRGAGSTDGDPEARAVGAMVGGGSGALVGGVGTYLTNFGIRAGRQIGRAIQEARGGTTVPLETPVSQGPVVDRYDAMRRALRATGATEESINLKVMASQARFGTPPNPVAEVSKTVGVAQQPGQALHGPSGAVIPGTEVSGMRAPLAEPSGNAVQDVLERRGYAPRGATQAQLGYRQGQLASRWLAKSPTPQSEQSVRALFANMPSAEREGAMRTFFTTYAPGRLHPDWVPVIQQLRAMP